MAARCGEAAASIVLLVTLTFVLAHASPGGPAYAIMGIKGSPDRVAAILQQTGADKSLWLQYATWWMNLLHGGLGRSFLLNQPVTGLLLGYAGRSLLLQIAGLSLGIILTLAGGIAHGKFYDTRFGRLLGAIEMIFYAMPGFVIGTFLALGCVGMLPSSGIADLHHAMPGLADRLRHLVLPALSLGLMTYSGLAPYLAEGIAAELRLPYARTALAKGLGPWAILSRHVLPNAVRPLITLLGLSLPALAAGSVAIESVFAYPGLGWLLWRSALSHDYPLLIGGVLLTGLATILGNLAADMVNTLLDPRRLYA
jgi:peptide/nickel transport system permease protein